MCEFCPTDSGPCCVCGPADLAAMIRAAEAELAEARQRAADAEHRLMKLRRLAGRRPGDGSDQLRLFEPATAPNLF